MKRQRSLIDLHRYKIRTVRIVAANPYATSLIGLTRSKSLNTWRPHMTFCACRRRGVRAIERLRWACGHGWSARVHADSFKVQRLGSGSKTTPVKGSNSFGGGHIVSNFYVPLFLEKGQRPAQKIIP
jgi:hypothetical protein